MAQAETGHGPMGKTGAEAPEMTQLDAVAEALRMLMREESAALRRADFAALAELLPQKEALARELEAAEPEGSAMAGGGSAGALSALLAEAQRNAGALRGAIGGVRAARLRLEELRRIESGTETYDRAGRKNLHSVRSGRVERRA
ncbi:hypothetical protein [Acidimangrovimonas sediminis]|uniref:hypothetical protein n=1 Tax=Acidimangrovimonas sediminis TaxID=2056283 RepID=UPI000C7F8191|nr:hypothetical protein [Acidimangrovimonas sediminis]